jgi:hypothetical protein
MLRQSAQAVRSSKWFDRIVLFLILANCVTLSLYDPQCDDACKHGSNKEWLLELAEYFFVAAFSAEILINVLANGLFFNEEGECRALRRIVSLWSCQDIHQDSSQVCA